MPKKMTRGERQRQFVLAYLSCYAEASAVNADFNDRFAYAFGRIEPGQPGGVRPLKRKLKLWGACPCPRALDVLRAMHRAGEIERTRISLIEHGQGFPNWIHSYSLPESSRMTKRRAANIITSYPTPAR